MVTNEERADGSGLVIAPVLTAGDVFTAENAENAEVVLEAIHLNISAYSAVSAVNIFLAQLPIARHRGDSWPRISHPTGMKRRMLP